MLKSKGISLINSKFEIDNKYGYSVCLKDTLFVPELKNNLLCVILTLRIRKLDEIGYKVVFGNDLALSTIIIRYSWVKELKTVLNIL